MTGRNGGWLLLLALAGAGVAWWGAGELAEPARALTVLLVAVLPVLLLGQGRIGEADARELPVVPVYVSSMIVIWGLGAAAAWAALLSGMTLSDLGFRALDPVAALVWTGAITLLAIGLLALGRYLGRRETPLLERILPRSPPERGVFVILSLSAGLGEEIAYRGFLIPALEAASGSMALAVVVSSFAFGMMHSYQSAAGVVRAGALGALLAAPLLATGSLWPSIVAHALIDLIAGLLLADWLVRGPDRGRGPDPRD